MRRCFHRKTRLRGGYDIHEDIKQVRILGWPLAGERGYFIQDIDPSQPSNCLDTTASHGADIEGVLPMNSGYSRI